MVILDDPDRGGSEPGAYADAFLFPPFVGRPDMALQQAFNSAEGCGDTDTPASRPIVSCPFHGASNKQGEQQRHA